MSEHHHHHEHVEITGMTVNDVLDMVARGQVPPGARFDADDSDRLMIAGEGYISVPVLTWRVDDD